MNGELQAGAERMEKAACFLTALLPLLLAFKGAPPDIAVSVIAALFLGWSALRRDFSWTREWWVRAALALWAYSVARAVFTPEPWYALREALPWVRFVLFAAALSHWTLRREKTRRMMFISLFCAVGFLGADALLQYFTGRDLLGVPYTDTPEHGLRLYGPYGRPIVGIMIAWLIFPCFAYVAAGRKVWLALPVALAFFAVVLSGERMALMLLGLGLALSFIFLGRARKIILVAGIMAALGAGGVFLAFPKVFERQIKSTVAVAGNLGGTPYGKIWEAALKMGSGNLLFGVGTNHYEIECKKVGYKDSEERCLKHPHNPYIEWFSENGLIGLGLWLALVILWLMRIFRDKPWRRDAATAGAVVALLLRLWPIASTTSFFINWGAIPMWMMAGWVVSGRGRGR